MQEVNGYKLRRMDVTTADGCRRLYDDWSLTVEGLVLKDVPALFQFLCQYTAFKTKEVSYYVIKGKVMNEVYGLMGKNRYPDRVHLVAFMLTDMVSPNAVALPRLQFGGRWFTDIVENNARHNRGV